MDKIHILFAITDSYVPYCAVALTSLFENNKNNKFEVHIICSDLSVENEEKLNRLFIRYKQEWSLIPIDAQKMRERLKEYEGGFHYSVLYRLLAAELLPPNLEKILYMDCDIIITNDLAPCYETAMNKEVALCAVADVVRINDYHRLKIKDDSHVYFNTGIMLINLEYWREHHIGMRCLAYIKHASSLEKLFPDQDALNVICQGHAKLLSFNYNMQTIYFADEKYLSVRVLYKDMPAIREAQQNPIIVHFSGEKPWYKGDYLPYRKEWKHFLSLTEWGKMKFTYKGGLKGWLQSLVMKSTYYILGKLGKTLALYYPVYPFKEYHRNSTRY